MKEIYESDFYKQLAIHLVTEYSVAEINRLLDDPVFLRREIGMECRGYDLCGPFTDAVLGDLFKKSNKVRVEHEIEKFANFLCQEIDLKRLRANIVKFIDL